MASPVADKPVVKPVVNLDGAPNVSKSRKPAKKHNIPTSVAHRTGGAQAEISDKVNNNVFVTLRKTPQVADDTYFAKEDGSSSESEQAPQTKKGCCLNCSKWKVLAIITGVLFAISAIALLALFVPPVAAIVAGAIGGAVVAAKVGAISGAVVFGILSAICGVRARMAIDETTHVKLM